MESSLGVGFVSGRVERFGCWTVGKYSGVRVRGEVELKCTVDRTSHIVCGIPLGKRNVGPLFKK